MSTDKRFNSFGSRPCRTLRVKILEGRINELPASWRQRGWMIQRIVATPPWANMNEIRKIYKCAKTKTSESGKLWTVGHIVPLRHPRVCGLHVHWNLKVESAALNFSKGNAWCEWHGDLFSEPEQLRLWS